ncbi:uncharacterized protein LOC110858894 [Folsomia candida]|nr:uncharacterized protein LOC110858894 [Folsomia candida]
MVLDAQKLIAGGHDVYIETIDDYGTLIFHTTSLFNTFIATQRTDWLERTMDITFTNGTVTMFNFAIGITDTNNHNPTFARNTFPYKQTDDGCFLVIDTTISVTDDDIGENCVQDVAITSSLPIAVDKTPIWEFGFMGFRLSLRIPNSVPKQNLYNHQIRLTAYDSNSSSSVLVTLQPY